MSIPVLVSHVVNFALVGVLAIAFFRKDGRIRLRWWLTTAPFVLCPVLLVVAAVGHLHALRPTTWTAMSEVVSLLISIGSIALMFVTLGTHRIRINMWHQDVNVLHDLVTYGPYRTIRHPFYTSYLVAFLGAFVYFPHWGTLALLGYAVWMLNMAARREERILAESASGAAYREYAARTGRFIPRWRSTASTVAPCPTSPP